MSKTDSELTDYLFQKGHRISKPLIQDIQAYTSKKVLESKIKLLKKLRRKRDELRLKQLTSGQNDE